MLVKASGANLESAAPADFVEVDRSRLLEIIDSTSPADDEDVAQAMRNATSSESRRPSVESLLHAVCLEVPEVSAVAHTHPIAVNSLLCSDQAEHVLSGSMFPDQIVVLGQHQMLVEYIDPGLPLARQVLRKLRSHIEMHGQYPKVIYLKNHGMFALGTDIDDALNITAMAVKCARILGGALAVGRPTFLDTESAARIDTRPDELLRRRLLARQ